MEKKTLIVFTPGTDIRQLLGSRFQSGAANMVGITSEKVIRDENECWNSFPDILVICDVCQCLEIQNIKSIIQKSSALYVVYHQGSSTQLNSNTKAQQNCLRELCKQFGKIIYEAVEHSTSGRAKEALDILAEAFKDEANVNSDLYVKGLKYLEQKPTYNDPYIEAKIHMWKALNLMALKFIQKKSISSADLSFEIKELKKRTRNADIKLSEDKLAGLTPDNFFKQLKEFEIVV